MRKTLLAALGTAALVMSQGAQAQVRDISHLRLGTLRHH